MALRLTGCVVAHTTCKSCLLRRKTVQNDSESGTHYVLSLGMVLKRNLPCKALGAEPYEEEYEMADRLSIQHFCVYKGKTIRWHSCSNLVG